MLIRNCPASKKNAKIALPYVMFMHIASVSLCSLAPPLCCVGGGTDESGNIAIQSVTERNALIIGSQF